MAKQSTKLPNPCLQFCFMKFIHEHTNKVPLDFYLIKININDLAHLYGSFPLDNFRGKKKNFLSVIEATICWELVNNFITRNFIIWLTLRWEN